MKTEHVLPGGPVASHLPWLWSTLHSLPISVPAGGWLESLLSAPAKESLSPETVPERFRLSRGLPPQPEEMARPTSGLPSRIPDSSSRTNPAKQGKTKAPGPTAWDAEASHPSESSLPTAPDPDLPPTGLEGRGGPAAFHLLRSCPDRSDRQRS